MAKKIRYIIVDAGKNTVKFVELLSNGTVRNLGSFPARYKEGSSNVVTTNFDFGDDSNEDKPLSKEKTFQVVYNGEHYILGEKGEDYCNFKDKSQQIHRLCAYTAIANMVDDGDDVHLIIGSTYNYVEDEDDKNSIRTYYKNTGTIKIKVNNVMKCFNIFDVSVYPEGLALLLRMKFKKKSIQTGFDIGGKSIDVYDFSTGISEYLTSDDMFGINKLYTKLESKLTLFAKNIKPTEKDYIALIKRESLDISLDEKQLDTLNKIIDNFVSKIVNFAFRYYDDIDRSCILFSGGSSIVLKERITEALKELGVPEENILFASSPFDNVFSYALSFLKELSGGDKADYAQRGSTFMKKAKKSEKEYMDNNE